MKAIKISIFLLFCILMTKGYDQIDNHQEIMAYYE